MTNREARAPDAPKGRSPESFRAFMHGTHTDSIALILALLAAAAPGPVVAQFRESVLTFDVPVSGYISVSSKDASESTIAVTGRTDDGRNVLFVHSIGADGRFDPTPVLRTELAEEILFYDAGSISGRTKLIFVESGGISLLDMSTGDADHLIDISSLYRGHASGQLESLDFVTDINEDGRDDIVLPDFDGYRIALQTSDGFETLELLELPARTRIEAGNVTYLKDTLHWYDFNADDRLDLGVVRDGQFVVFHARADGSFQTLPAYLPIYIDLAEDSQAEAVQSMFGADQSDLRVSGITDVRDLNRDELPDIVTFTAKSSGVFDKNSEYRIYLAQRRGEDVVYGPEHDAVIDSGGFQIGLSPVATSTGAAEDLVVTSVDFGFRQLIAALVTRSVALDISLHRFLMSQTYSSEPDFESSVRVSINVSTGYVSNPAVRFGDFDGDGHADFLVQEDETELKIRRGRTSEETFDREAIEWMTRLPVDGTRIAVDDLNADGKDDLIVAYGNGDDEETRRTLRILVSTM